MTRILYASVYGSTQQYAEELGRRLEVTPQRIDDTDPATWTGEDPVIVLSYAHGPKVPAAAFLTRHDLGHRPVAACLVGMSQIEEVRRLDPLRGLLGGKAESVARFYLPGRLNYSELSAKHSAIMAGVIGAIRMKRNKTENDRAMIELHNKDVDRVDLAELDPVEKWARGRG